MSSDRDSKTGSVEKRRDIIPAAIILGGCIVLASFIFSFVHKSSPRYQIGVGQSNFYVIDTVTGEVWPNRFEPH